MKNFIVTLVVLIAGISISYSQQKNSSIKDRWREDLPIFSFTPCSPFLIEFGSKSEDVIKKASESGIIFHSKTTSNIPEGGYVLAFYDEDNLRTNDGHQITDLVIYLFFFTKEDAYFSFSTRITCENVYISQALLEKLNVQIVKSWGTKTNYGRSTISSCQDKTNNEIGRDMSVSTFRDDTNVDLTIVDLVTFGRSILNR